MSERESRLLSPRIRGDSKLCKHTIVIGRPGQKQRVIPRKGTHDDSIYARIRISKIGNYVVVINVGKRLAHMIPDIASLKEETGCDIYPLHHINCVNIVGRDLDELTRGIEAVLKKNEDLKLEMMPPKRVV